MNNNPIADITPVTPTQLGFLYLDKSTNQQSLYNEQYLSILTGDIDLDRLYSAWTKTVEAHSILRTFFDWDGENDAVQVVLRNIQPSFSYLDKKMSEAELLNYVSNDLKCNFSLDTDPPHRLTIVSTEEGSHWFIFTYHHILLDGSSTSRLLQYFTGQYNSPHSVDRVNDFGLYVDWTRSQDKDLAMYAWKNYIGSMQVPSYIPADDAKLTKVSEYSYTLDKHPSEAIVQVAKNSHLTLSSVFQTVWAATLSQLRSVQSVCIGSPVTAKPLDASLDYVVGMCITTIPYIISFDASKSMLEIAQDHQSSWSRLIEYSYLSLSDIKKSINYQNYGDPFDTILTYTDLRTRLTPSINDIEWEPVAHSEITQYTLSIDAVTDNESITLKATYNEEAYSPEKIAELIHSFADNLVKFARNPDMVPVFDSLENVDGGDRANLKPVPIAELPDNAAGKIIEAWSAVFDTSIDADSNFFELGGDSISSLRILSKLRSSNLNVSMRDIFDYPTPRLLIDRVSKAKHNVEPNDVSGLPDGVHSSAKRLYGDSVDLIAKTSNVQHNILKRSLVNPSLYHDQSTFTYQGVIDPVLYEKAWTIVLASNDTAKMKYFACEEAWYAAKSREFAIDFTYNDLTDDANTDIVIQDDITVDAQTPYELGAEPPIRLKLYRKNSNTFVLFLSFHIILTDGWSFAFLLDDVFTVYENLLDERKPRSPVRLPSLSDYLSSFNDTDLVIGRQHWSNYLKDKNIQKVPSVITNFTNLKEVHAKLNESETKALQDFSGRYRLSINSVIQAAWAMTNGEPGHTVLFGATVASRVNHSVSYDDTIGLFFNDIPVVARIKSNDIRELASTLQHDFQTNLPYSYISSYEIASSLGIKEYESPYESLVVFENYPKMQEDSLKSERRGGVRNTDYWRRDMADIPLTLYVEVHNDRSDLKLSYNLDIITEANAKTLLDRFTGILKSCT